MLDKDKAKEDDEINAIEDENERLMVLAAKNGNENALKDLLKKNVDPAVSDNLALRLAAKGGRTGVVKSLLEHPSVDPTVFSNIVICDAATYGHTEVVKLLLADPRISPDDRNNASLIFAAEAGHAEIVQLLLADKRVNPAAENNTAITLAAEGGHTEVVKLLLADKRVNPAVRANRPLQNAVGMGHIEVVKLLLGNARVDPGAKNNLAICVAAEKGFTEIVALLMAHPNVDPGGNNEAIIFAAEKGHTDVVRLLMTDHRVNPAAHNNESLISAVKRGHTEVVRLLMTDLRVDPAADKNEPIISAAKEGHTEIVKLLLANEKVDPTVDHNFAIRIAAEIGHTEVVKLLLAHPRVSPEDSNNAAMILAAEGGHTEIVKLLLADPRVSPSARNNEPIISAAREGHTEIVKLLLANEHVDPTVDRNFAIRIAAERGHTEVVKLLLADKRVNVDIYAIRTALKAGHIEIAKIMFEHAKYYGLPLSEMIDIHTIDDQKIINEIDTFIDNPITYLKNATKTNGKVSPSQIEALKIILYKEDINKMEAQEEQRIAEDPETAMEDSAVKSANETFEKIVKPYIEKKFMEYIPSREPDPVKAKMKAICAIEEQIRGLILDEILKNSNDPQLHQFINQPKVKAELIKGTNEALMNEVREKYFNSKEDPMHIAWRGYDPYAPFKGVLDNLLTEQTEEKRIFTTRIAAQEVDNVTNRIASDVVRERVAYYYLLMQDKDEKTTKEDIDNRVVNFISELADLRRAHSEHHEGKPDAPSCYPGYLGRIANLGYGHPLTHQKVTKKVLIQEIMRPIILDKFKDMLSQEKGMGDCEKVLKALSDLTEKTKTHLGVFTKKDKYPDELLDIRLKFVNSFDEALLFDRVNKELTNIGNVSIANDLEEMYVFQSVVDPCRDKMMGPIGKAYHQHIKTTYPDEMAELQRQDIAAQKARQIILSKIVNPYKGRYDLMCKQAQRNPAQYGKLVSKLENKMKNFEKLAEFLPKELNELINEKDKDQIASLTLLLEIMTELLGDAVIDNVQETSKKLLSKDEKERDALNKELQFAQGREGSDQMFGLLDAIDKHYAKASTQMKFKH